MKAGGLRIQMPDGELRVSDKGAASVRSRVGQPGIRYRVSRGQIERPSLDGGIHQAVSEKRRRAGPVQNGLNDDSIASIVGRQRVVGCALELSAEIFTPGLVKRNTTHADDMVRHRRARRHGTPRACARSRRSCATSAASNVTGNIYSAKWTKLIANTMTMGPFGLLGLGNSDAANLPGMFEISVAARQGISSQSAKRSASGMRADIRAARR